MSTNNNSSSTHHTITSRKTNTGHSSWEFLCPDCGYRARYTVQPNQRGPQLEILHIGNPQARHTSKHVKTRLDLIQSKQVADEVDDEHLREQIEDLLKDVDMGDWDIQ